MYLIIHGSPATQLGQGCGGKWLQDTFRVFGSFGPYGLTTVAVGLQVFLCPTAANLVLTFDQSKSSTCRWPAGSCQEVYMHHQSWDAL